VPAKGFAGTWQGAGQCTLACGLPARSRFQMPPVRGRVEALTELRAAG